MKILKLSDFKGGWIVGDFMPSVLRTDKFEVALLFHAAGKNHPTHFHKIATEYNILVSGRMTVNGVLLGPGDVFVLEPWEISQTEFLADCQVVCVKVPSVPGDKYEVMMTPAEGIKLDELLPDSDCPQGFHPSNK